MKNKKSFTLIELLVVIAIIGLLSTVVLVSLQGVRARARDSRRKTDLKTIRTALEQYYNDYGKYPPAGSCAYGSPTTCYVFSTAGDNWIPALAPYFNGKIPKDPINNADSPWDISGNNHSYSYGNVTADGEKFDLTTNLENTSDSDRCGIKDYRWNWNNTHWCVAFGGDYSNQIYEDSPR